MEKDAQGKLSSVQLTKLDDQGRRALTRGGEKLNKIQYGLSKESFVALQQGKETDPVFVAEGVETALSIKEAGVKGKIVASMGVHNISTIRLPRRISSSVLIMVNIRYILKHRRSSKSKRSACI